MKVAIALGGGAPNLTLMTGALKALDEAGIDFEVITTTGAGMVAGLLWAAPRRDGETESWAEARARALAATREMGIDDLIYSQFPANYKIFQKPGAMAEAYAHLVTPPIWSIPRETRRQRLLGDGLGLFAAMMQPSDLSSESQGLCQPPPWIGLMVDFTELQSNLADPDRAFSLSAYCIEDREEHHFTKEQITAEHFKAGLAMPFLYAPYELKTADSTRTYLEGSAIRTMQFNPNGVMQDRFVDTLIYFDLMGNRHLMGKPKNLIDAWGKSIVAPLTQLAYLQEQLAELKKFASNIMRQNEEIVTSFNYMTMDVEAELNKLKADVADEVKPAVDGMLETITRSREYRREVIDNADKVMGDLASDRMLVDHLYAQYASESPAGIYEHTPPSNMESYFELTYNELNRVAQTGGEWIDPDQPKMLRMPFRNHLPPEHWDTALDWSYSNMSRLYDIGYDTARHFIYEHWDDLGQEEQPKKPELNYPCLLTAMRESQMAAQ